VNVRAKFEVRSFAYSWDNSWYFKTFGMSLDTLMLSFSKIFMGFCSDGSHMEPVNVYRPNVKSVALPVPEIGLIDSFISQTQLQQTTQ